MNLLNIALSSLSLCMAPISQDDIAEQFRNEFKGKVVYRLGARGPKYYDCSTSIAYIFAKNGMLRDKNGKMFTAASYQRSSYDTYNPAFMDQDKINFRVVPNDEDLQVADALLITGDDKNCNKPIHWVILSAIYNPEQKYWHQNTFMEVKGDPTNRGKWFDESTNTKYHTSVLCKAVRHKAFQ